MTLDSSFKAVEKPMTSAQFNFGEGQLGFSPEGRDGAGDETTGRDVASDGEEDHLVTGSGDTGHQRPAHATDFGSATRKRATKESPSQSLSQHPAPSMLTVHRLRRDFR
jgi:hypothetical protein